MMVKSLSLPALGLKEDTENVEAAQKMLLTTLWRRRSYYLLSLTREVAVGGQFESPARVLARQDLHACLLGHTIDPQGSDAAGSEESGKESTQDVDVGDTSTQTPHPEDQNHQNDGKGGSKKPGKRFNIAPVRRLLSSFKPSLSAVYHSQGATELELQASITKHRKDGIPLGRNSRNGPSNMVRATPIQWQRYLSNGSKDFARTWLIAGVMEHQAISLYRTNLVASGPGGWIRQELERHLKPFLKPAFSSFPWPDLIPTPQEHLKPPPDPESPLAELDIQLRKVVAAGTEEINDILSRIQNSFVAVTGYKGTSIPLRPLDDQPIPPEVEFASNVLFTVGAPLFSLKIFSYCILYHIGADPAYQPPSEYMGT